MYTLYMYSLLLLHPEAQGGAENQHGQIHRDPEPGPNTVGFHNFNLGIFNLRVSNPNKLIVGVFC